MYQKTIETDPGSPEAYFNLANLYREVKNLKLAIKHYLEVIKLQSSNSSAYTNIGLAYWENGSQSEALEALKTAHLLDSSSRTLTNLAAFLPLMEFKSFDKGIEKIFLQILECGTQIRGQQIATSALKFLHLEPKIQRVLMK